MGKHKLFFRIFVLTSVLFINTSCEFIYDGQCLGSIRSELGLSRNAKVPDKYCDFCNCFAKWRSDGYSETKAIKECKAVLNE